MRGYKVKLSSSGYSLKSWSSVLWSLVNIKEGEEEYELRAQLSLFFRRSLQNASLHHILMPLPVSSLEYD